MSFANQALAAPGGYTSYSAMASPQPTPTYYLGAGPLSESMGRDANDETASTTSLFNAMYINLQVQARYHLSGSWVFNPEVSYTPFGLSSPDGGEKFRVLTVGTRADYRFRYFDLRSGPELLVRFVSASGGTIQLDNGTGTSTFALAPESRTQDLLAWNFGIGTEFHRVRFDFDLLVTDFASSARRALDGVWVMSYGVF